MAMRAAFVRRRQSGVALLVVLLIVFVASAALLLADGREARARHARLKTTQTMLAEAKQALLDFAVTNPDRMPGQGLQLACPDLDGSGPWVDGEAHASSCGAAGVSMLGRLPWRTLGLGVPRDSSASCLWYAVSGTYKSAGAHTAAMINPDSNGQFQLVASPSGLAVTGSRAADRAVAVIIAPQAPLDGQTRFAGGGMDRCATSFNAGDYLDVDLLSGVSNVAVGAVANTVDQFVTAEVDSADLNDRIVTISRRELADAVYRRPDMVAMLDDLTRGIASCIAAYGLSNPGGAADRRLPLPAPVTLPNYDLNASYDDADSGRFSGRLPDDVGDSSALTGNALTQVLSDCDPALANAWDVAYLPKWQHWKDHFFYVVAESFQPYAAAPSTCGNCLSVNGAGNYAAIVLFSGRRLIALAQRRDSPPLDADTKNDIDNYLEGVNAANHPYTGGASDYLSAPVSATFNDILYCVDPTMAVSTC